MTELYPKLIVGNISYEGNSTMAPLFDEDMERIISISVFVLFGIIGVAGLVGNALVVLGK